MKMELPERKIIMQQIESELEKVQKWLKLMREMLGVGSASAVAQDEDNELYSVSGSMVS